MSDVMPDRIDVNALIDVRDSLRVKELIVRRQARAAQALGQLERTNELAAAAYLVQQAHIHVANAARMEYEAER